MKLLLGVYLTKSELIMIYLANQNQVRSKFCMYHAQSHLCIHKLENVRFKVA